MSTVWPTTAYERLKAFLLVVRMLIIVSFMSMMDGWSASERVYERQDEPLARHTTISPNVVIGNLSVYVTAIIEVCRRNLFLFIYLFVLTSML